MSERTEGQATKHEKPQTDSPALHTSRTARALARHRGHALRWLVLGVVVTAVCVVAAWLGATRGIEWIEGVGSRLAAGGVVCIGLGASGLYANSRMRRFLKAGPWLTRRAHQFPPSRWKGAGVVLRDPSGELCPLLVLATRQRARQAVAEQDGSVWWCPGPGGRGVLVHPDGDELLYVRPPFTSWGRRTRVEDAKKAGLGA
ncbi:hypothetical protein [Streptomyces sp. NPDC002853]